MPRLSAEKQKDAVRRAQGRTISNALRLCSGHFQRNFIIICDSGKSAELVGAKPLHLLTQTALPLKSPTGAFIAAQTRIFPNRLFTGRVVKAISICFLFR